MSVIGMRARNHPNQVKPKGDQSALWAPEELGAADEVDDRATPKAFFDLLNKRFRFTVDAAASDQNAQLPRYWTARTDGLAQTWAGERVWCNPPYSNIPPWIRKAWLERDAAELIVMLLPANRTEQTWWQKDIEPHRDLGGLCRVEFLPGRLRFLKPGQKRAGPNERPPFGCCLVIWGEERK